MAKHKPTIAITGASGFLGGALVQYFADKGWNVVGLVRQPAQQKSSDSPTAGRLSQITYKEYDITRPLTKDTLKGVDYVVHAAYIKYDKAHPDALDVNLEGAKKLLQACRANKVQRTVFISTMSAHEDAISVYGKQKMAVEAVFSTPESTIFKSGLIIGNGGIVKQMSDFMKSKRMVPLIAGGKQPLQIVAVQDLVRATEAALQKNIAGIYVIATPQIYTYREFYRALANRLGVRILYVPIPYWLLQAVFRAAALLHFPLGVGEDNLKGLKMLQAMESKEDLQQLGVSLMPLNKALEEVEL